MSSINLFLINNQLAQPVLIELYHFTISTMMVRIVASRVEQHLSFDALNHVFHCVSLCVVVVVSTLHLYYTTKHRKVNRVFWSIFKNSRKSMLYMGLQHRIHSRKSNRTLGWIGQGVICSNWSRSFIQVGAGGI